MVRHGQKEVPSMKARRYEFIDKEWELVQPLIPISHTGCPQKDIRAHLNGILWLARSGARWSDLPARFGPHQTVYSCFCRWRDDGPVAFLLSAGNVDDCTEAVPLLKLLSDLKDCDILADKAYGTKEIRTYLHDQSARYTIPPKVNTKQPWPFDKETYKRRNVIEHFFNRLREFRRAETRYDKRDDSFLAFVMVAAICVAFGILHS